MREREKEDAGSNPGTIYSFTKQVALEQEMDQGSDRSKVGSQSQPQSRSREEIQKCLQDQQSTSGFQAPSTSRPSVVIQVISLMRFLPVKITIKIIKLIN